MPNTAIAPEDDSSTSPSKTKWGDDDDDLDEEDIPPIQVIGPDKNGVKTVIEIRKDDNGKLVKVTTKFQQKKQKTKLTHAEVERKSWKKFGAAAGSKPGPDPAQTLIADEVFLTLTTKSSELDDISSGNPLSASGAGGSGGAGAGGSSGAAGGGLSSADSLKKMVVCRLCKGDHWTTKCPYKDALASIEKTDDDGKKPDASSSLSSSSSGSGAAGGGAGAASSSAGGKYVPPSMREGGRRTPESLGSRPGSDRSQANKDDATVRVSNLSEETDEADLYDLFKKFGSINRTFLARDKNSGFSKGFAFISFMNKPDAARAIEQMHGHGFNHLILSVEWAKPSGH